MSAPEQDGGSFRGVAGSPDSGARAADPQAVDDVTASFRHTVSPPDGGEAGAAIAPESPEGFRLAAEPPHVMRLSRKALASIGAVAGVSIGGALLWALQPVSPRPPENLYRAGAAAKAGAVAAAPAGYDAIPKLGPPLPGDLGRPIVAAQAEGGHVPAPPIGPAPGGRPDPAEEARMRAEQEQQSAEASRLFLSGASAGAGAVPATTIAAAAANEASAEPATRAAQRRAFMAGGGAKEAENAERIRAPSSEAILQAGSIIPAALITGIRSDLPGQVTAQVTQNVYDSPSGKRLLIPQGARLVGEYDSDIAAGQSRVLLAWERLILPGGRSIDLGRLPGADAAGMAGLADRTDHHWGQMLRAALVSTLLGAGAEIGTDADDRLARAIRNGTQDTINQTGQRLVERQMAVPPTLTVRPGFAFRVLVTRDLVFEPEGRRP